MKNQINTYIILRNATINATIERVEGQNVYVESNGEILKFHIDELLFTNEVNARKFEKFAKKSGTPYKVPMGRIAMALSEGNKKLKDSSVVSFYQWNMTAVESCPYRTEMCEKACYALKAEKMYPTVKSRRASNLEFAKTDMFTKAMIEQIEYELSRKKNEGKTIFFRIHESGDFFSFEYLLKWIDITNYFKGNRNIVFMAYTKSLPFVSKAYKILGGEKAVNIAFKSSIWEDTKPKFVKMTKDLGMGVFTAMPKGQIEKQGYFACPSSESFKGTENEKDCGQCKACYLAPTSNVAIEIH